LIEQPKGLPSFVKFCLSTVYRPLDQIETVMEGLGSTWSLTERAGRSAEKLLNGCVMGRIDRPAVAPPRHRRRGDSDCRCKLGLSATRQASDPFRNNF